MTTAKDALFAMVGGEENARKIMAEVKENHRKIDSCDFHDFSIDASPEKKYGKKWTCTRCGGTVDWSTKIWYEKGVEHANSRRNNG